MKMKTLKEAIKAIADTAPDLEVRNTRRIEIGQAIHQGDVYLHRVNDDHPRGELLATKQVAIGTNVGARHVVSGEGFSVYKGKQLPPGVTEPDWCEEGSLLGPVVVFKGGPCEGLTHPEHADHKFQAGTYQVTYQLDGATMRRVVD